VPPAPGADVALVASGPVVTEACEAHQRIVEEYPGAGLLVVTSPGRLHHGWIHALHRNGDDGATHVSRLLQPLAASARLVTVLDGHPATLSWLGSIRGHRVVPLGVDRFGQSGDIPDLYRAYELDVDAIVRAVSRPL
jgi:pyruvate dehydrogenase E1 component